MTNNHIQEIRERCEKATPGPWKVIDRGNTVPSYAVATVAFDGIPQVTICPNMSPRTSNAAFIAHAREDIPFLLSQLAEREAEVERLKATIERYCRHDCFRDSCTGNEDVGIPDCPLAEYAPDRIAPTEMVEEGE